VLQLSIVVSEGKVDTLLQFVEFEYVSPAIALRFIKSSTAFFDMIDSSIWPSFGPQFIQYVLPSISNSRLAAKEPVPRGKSINGIILYLRSQDGSNSPFLAKDWPDSWICHDVKDTESH
jgi:hypothetical protein